MSTRMVVNCERCGGLLLELTVDDPVGLASQVADAVGDGIECARCHTITQPPVRLIPIEAEGLQVVQRARTADVHRQRIRGVRWAVRDTIGRRSSVWRLWVNRSDVYVAERDTAQQMKVSLHASGKWRWGFCEQYAATISVLADRDRAWHRWQRPTEVSPGWTRAFEIVCPSSALARAEVEARDAEKAIWYDAPPDGHSTHFNVLIAGPGARGPGNRGFAVARGHEDSTEVVSAIDLENGERVWVIRHTQPTSEQHKEQLRLAAEAVNPRVAHLAADPGPRDLWMTVVGEYSDGAWYFIEGTLRRGHSEGRPGGSST